jgi:hypothetical protein
LKKLCKNENALFVQVEDYYPEENPYPQPFPLVKGKGENHLFPQ